MMLQMGGKKRVSEWECRRGRFEVIFFLLIVECFRGY